MSKNGFTLIETTLYVAIFAIIIVAIINVGISLSTSAQNTGERSLLVSESSVVMNKISRIISEGQTFNAGGSTLDQTLSTLAFANNSGDSTVLRVTNGVLEHGVNSNYSDMHSGDITITRFLVESLNSFATENIFRVSVDFTNTYGDTFTVTTSVNFLYD